MYKVFVFIGFLIVGLLVASCEDEYSPKPRGFFRITLPEKKYVHYSPSQCPFEFDIPAYARVSEDSSKITAPCFLNIDFVGFNGTLYLSYKPVHNDLVKLLEDHRLMTMKHIPKASAIDEQAYDDSPHHVYGSINYVKGNTASNVQFYLTDNTQNFIRGSLYFNNIPQPDSIAPVLDYISKDVKHLAETFRWK